MRTSVELCCRMPLMLRCWRVLGWVGQDEVERVMSLRWGGQSIGLPAAMELLIDCNVGRLLKVVVRILPPYFTNTRTSMPRGVTPTPTTPTPTTPTTGNDRQLPCPAPWGVCRGLTRWRSCSGQTQPQLSQELPEPARRTSPRGEPKESRSPWPSPSRESSRCPSCGMRAPIRGTRGAKSRGSSSSDLSPVRPSSPAAGSHGGQDRRRDRERLKPSLIGCATFTRRPATTGAALRGPRDPEDPAPEAARSSGQRRLGAAAGPAPAIATAGEPSGATLPLAQEAGATLGHDRPCAQLRHPHASGGGGRVLWKVDSRAQTSSHPPGHSA